LARPVPSEHAGKDDHSAEESYQPKQVAAGTKGTWTGNYEAAN
jgi:hypothetical protein